GISCLSRREGCLMPSAVQGDSGSQETEGLSIMSESQPSKVFMFDDSDPEMQRAYEKARATFRYFWREVAWERRRIVPALDLACVKAPFADGEGRPRSSDEPNVEQM